MFTGIIEALGEVKSIESHGTNKTFWVESSLFPELKVDQSLAHDGVCLTIEALTDGLHRVTAIQETLNKTNLNHWKIGTLVNLERCLLPTSRLDGHFVQGHIDTTGTCLEILDKSGSWELTFQFPEAFAALVIEKGSICINGVSLTAFDVTSSSLRVGIIPYTWQHTNLKNLKLNETVNLEFDLIGKYVIKKSSLENRI